MAAFLCAFAIPGAVASGNTTKTTAAKATKTTVAKSAKPSVGNSTILLGLVSGTSGAYASTGEATLDGALLGVSDVNKRGGVLGKQLTMQSYDDEASSTLAATLFTRLAKAGAVAIVGSDDSGGVTAETADQLHVPDLGVVGGGSTTGATAGATSSANTALPWVWSSGPGSAAVGAIDAAYALKSCTGLALLHDTSAYGEGGAAQVKLAYAKAHRKLALDDAIGESPLTGASVSATTEIQEIKQIRASRASCVLAWLTPENTASLAQTLRGDHVKVKVIGSSAIVADQTFSELAGAAANGTIAPELVTQLHPDSSLTSFIKAYKAKYHLAPTADAITSYDTVLVLAAAIRRERSTNPSKLQAALNGLAGTPELQGTVAFTEADHLSVSPQQLTLVSYDAAAKTWKPLP